MLTYILIFPGYKREISPKKIKTRCYRLESKFDSLFANNEQRANPVQSSESNIPPFNPLPFDYSRHDRKIVSFEFLQNRDELLLNLIAAVTRAASHFLVLHWFRVFRGAPCKPQSAPPDIECTTAQSGMTTEWKIAAHRAAPFGKPTRVLTALKNR